MTVFNPQEVSKLTKANEEQKTVKKYVHRAAVGKTVYEVVLFHNIPMFLCYSAETGFKLEKEIAVENNILLVPVKEDMIPYRPYILEDEVIKSLREGNYKITKQEVYDEIFDKVDMHIDVEPVYKTLLVAHIMETYIQYKLSSVGYVFISGIHNSGKSRVCAMANLMGYRPLYALGINSANIFQYIGSDKDSEGQVSIIEDEIDPKNEKLDSDLVERLKIYRSGYQKGNKVPRVLDGGSSERMQKFYRTYCSKLLAGYGYPKDEAFVERCIDFPMIKGKPECDELLDEELPDFDKIKFKALIFRILTYFDALPIRELKLNGRMKEIWKCKIMAVADTDAEAIITDLAYQNLKDKFDEGIGSLECKVLQVVLDQGVIYNWNMIAFRFIWAQLLKTLGITEEEYDKEAEKNSSVFIGGMTTPVSPNTVGRILLSMIHGKRVNASGIGRMYSFDKSIVKKIS